MSPLLTSLSLLALCWQPSAGLSWKLESFDTQSSIAFLTKEQQAQFGQSIKGRGNVGNMTQEQELALINTLPNTLLLIGFHSLGVTDDIPFLVRSLHNGMACEFDDAKLSEKLNEITFGHREATAQDRTRDAAEMREIGVECGKPAPSVDHAGYPAAFLRRLHECFCAENKPSSSYCTLATIREALKRGYEQKMGQLTKQPCRDETVPALLKAGSGALGRLYDSDSFGKDTLNDAFVGNLGAFENDQMKSLLCDAVDTDVENAVRAVYASDGLYWIAEHRLYSIIFGPPENATIKQACHEDAFKSDFGECVCKQDTGFAFCVYKTIAQHFVKEGFLTCDRTDKTRRAYNAEKRPHAMPQLARKGELPTSSAATSSLTAASLAAAVLLLARD